MLPGSEGAAAPAAGPALRIAAWLVPFAILGVVLVRLYPDSYQQDGGFHFLFARWSPEHPRYLVDVWARPLFTVLYALPSRLGYPAAKLVTVAVSLAAGWHTARLAREHGLERAPLAVPLLLLQPAFLLISSETMTEPLFALVLAVALRLHRAGRIRAGMWLASLLPLARPEGFFVAALWGAFVLFDRRAGRTFLLRSLSVVQLAGGVALWWLAALLLTSDPLFILHNWPRNWGVTESYGTGPLWHYLVVRDQVLAGPILQALFVLGLGALVAARRATLEVASLALVAGLHSVFYRFGLFGSAGYARYLVCVAPPMALATLAGWNLAAGWLRRAPRLLASLAGTGVLLAAAAICLDQMDAWGSSRDARAVQDMQAWFLAHPRPVKRLVFSQAYMSIRFDRDPNERPPLVADPEKNVQILRASTPGTLVFWDAHTGPQFHAIGPAELERAGYELLHAQSYELEPRLPLSLSARPPYRQELILYYKAQ
jgi:hypothetical protein